MACSELSPHRYLGEGAIERVADILSQERPRKILLVTGRGSYAVSGAERALSPMLRDLSVARFKDFELNPVMPDVEQGIQLCREVRPDIVLAIGGGSVIDM